MENLITGAEALMRSLEHQGVCLFLNATATTERI